jgi:hypothetical protein
MHSLHARQRLQLLPQCISQHFMIHHVCCSIVNDSVALLHANWLTAHVQVLLRTSSTASSSASSLGGSSAGSAGLALSYALTITRTLSFGVRAATAMENQFNAVERIEEFTVLQQEPQVQQQQQQQQLVVSPSSSGSSSSDGISLHQVCVYIRLHICWCSTLLLLLISHCSSAVYHSSSEWSQ